MDTSLLSSLKEYNPDEYLTGFVFLEGQQFTTLFAADRKTGCRCTCRI